MMSETMTAPPTHHTFFVAQTFLTTLLNHELKFLNRLGWPCPGGLLINLDLLTTEQLHKISDVYARHEHERNDDDSTNNRTEKSPL